MRYFIIIVVTLALSFVGYLHFSGKKMLFCKTSTTDSPGSEKIDDTIKKVDNSSNTNASKEIKDIGKQTEEWRKMVMEMRTVLNNIKEMQIEQLQKGQ